jgi:hypothetical protein
MLNHSQPVSFDRIPAPEEVVISRHASDQHHRRYCPWLSADDSWSQLRHGLRRARVTRKRPAWLQTTTNPTHQLLTVAYLVINDCLALPIQIHNGRYVARTCLVRGYNPLAAQLS